MTKNQLIIPLYACVLSDRISQMQTEANSKFVSQNEAVGLFIVRI